MWAHHPQTGEVDLRELAAVVTAVRMKLTRALLVEPDSTTKQIVDSRVLEALVRI